MEGMGLKFIAVGLMAFGMLGAAIGVGTIFAALVNGVARNPSAEPQMLKNAIIGAGLAEAMGLFAFVLAMILLFVI
jgi:F-type H+-transporting ATPase subunit c